MTWLDIATLLIAFWGASLATYFGLREARKEIRRISIILEYVAFNERSRLRIINIGHGPITITEIGLSVFAGESGNNHWEEVPQMHIVDFGEEENPFQVTLMDGQQVSIWLEGVVDGLLKDSSLKAMIRVYEAEGNVYTKSEKSCTTQNGVDMKQRHRVENNLSERRFFGLDRHGRSASLCIY